MNKERKYINSSILIERVDEIEPLETLKDSGRIVSITRTVYVNGNKAYTVRRYFGNCLDETDELDEIESCLLSLNDRYGTKDISSYGTENIGFFKKVWRKLFGK